MRNADPSRSPVEEPKNNSLSCTDHGQADGLNHSQPPSADKARHRTMLTCSRRLSMSVGHHVCASGATNGLLMWNVEQVVNRSMPPKTGFTLPLLPTCLLMPRTLIFRPSRSLSKTTTSGTRRALTELCPQTSLRSRHLFVLDLPDLMWSGSLLVESDPRQTEREQQNL